MENDTTGLVFVADGYELPAGTKPNTDIEVVAKIRQDENGAFKLVEVEGVPVSGGNSEKEDSEADAQEDAQEATFAQTLSQDME